jgi:hypothetical protein
MPEFPRDEEGIIDLGRRFAGGLNLSGIHYATMPVSKVEFEMLMAEYNALIGEITQIKAQQAGKIADKKKVLGKITAGLKRNLRFLELMTNGSDAELTKYGWGARRKRQKLKPPEQPRYLEDIKQGEDYLILDWKAPFGGGKVKSYKIYRRIEDENEPQVINSALSTEIKLLNQPRKVTLQFYVTAVNNAGESLPSNTVSVVL